jgi:hypothetical protein
MNGYIVYWTQEQIRKLEKAGDKGPLCVIYGSHHTAMPSISSVKVGDIIFPVTLIKGTLYAVGRLPVEKIEPAFEYTMRELGNHNSAILPNDVMIRSQGKNGTFLLSNIAMGYEKDIVIPDSINTIIDEMPISKPHLRHQIPVTCCASLAASGEHGSEIALRPIPNETALSLRFGKTDKTAKLLKTNKDGVLTSISLACFVRRMSKDTFEIFEKIFNE